jgi:acyl carrier protein
MIISKKLNFVVCSALGISENEVSLELAYDSIPQWDSIGHMMLIAELENEFDITIEPEKIMEMNSLIAIIEAVDKSKQD